MRQLVLLLGLCLLLPQTAWAKWTRLSSEHFVFVGDAPEREVRTIAQRLEQFREVVGRVLGSGTISSPVPTLVVVFQNDRSFADFRPVFQGKPVPVGGYFIGGEDANVIAVNAAQTTETYGVIFHEYSHYMLGSAVGTTPVWVNEGLAELYQTFEASNGGRTAFIGKPSLQNLGMLRASSQLMTTAQLVAVEHDSPQYNEGDRRGLLYAQSWALVHYLTFGSKERQGQLSKYLNALQRGASDADAFSQAFGADGSTRLDAELRKYISGFVFQTLRIEFDERVTAGSTSPSEAITDVEAAGYLGELVGRINGRADDARAMLKKTIEANPDAARALAALGSIELRADRDEAALPLLERAATLAPGTASIQAAYGRALTRRASRDGADEEALHAKARTALSRALELEPDNASTLVTLAEVEMASGANPARALSLMQRAVKSSPSREEYRLMLGQAMAMNGDYRGAQGALALLLARGSSAGIRDAARATMGRVATAEHAARDLAAAAREPLVDSTAGTSPVAAGRDEPRRETMQQGAYVPTLRPLQVGESQVLGSFVGVDCRPGAIVLQIDAAAGPVRMAVKSFNEVEFLTYRPDSPTSVACGTQRPAYRVLATFRMASAPLAGAGTANHAVAIELLPDGYTPPSAR